MLTITLICTSHSEIGKCNPDELHNIFESINPEIIFEELSNRTFDLLYNGIHHPHEPTEVKCIKKYVRSHNVKHLPVDIEPNPNLSKNEIDYMFNSFRMYDVYKKLEDEQAFLTKKDGFPFLNSEKCSELFDKKKASEKNLIGFAINKNTLSRIHKLFYEEHDHRENEMIQNIYNYSKEHSYSKAIFTIGAGHRKSILQKIQLYEKKESLKLNWIPYNASITS